MLPTVTTTLEYVALPMTSVGMVSLPALKLSAPYAEAPKTSSKEILSHRNCAANDEMNLTSRSPGMNFDAVLTLIGAKP
jgi:hypothetical protein